MVSLVGASAPPIFLISMVGMVAIASSLAQFASIYPSAGSFITYITRAIGTKVAVAVGVITILGYIIAIGGIYIFVGIYIAQNVFGNPHTWGLTQIITIARGGHAGLSGAPFHWPGGFLSTYGILGPAAAAGPGWAPGRRDR